MCEEAWAAGFWDGEGHTRIARNSVRMQTAQIHPEVLERLQRLLGGNIYGPYIRAGKSPLWCWTLVGVEKVQVAVDRLRPFLSSQKILQADAALAGHVPTQIGCKGHPLREEIVNRYAQGESPSALAREYGVHPTSVTKMVRRLRPEEMRAHGGRRRGMPGDKHGPSVKKPKVYDALRDKGYSKTKAAKISNADAKKSKKKG